MSTSTDKGNISGALKFITLLVMAILIVLIGELMVSNIVRAGKYVDPVVAKRVVSGTIYDRNGRTLALDIPSTDLYVRTDGDQLDTMSQIISLHTEMTPDAIKQAIANSSNTTWVAIARNLGQESASKLSEAFESNGLSGQYRIEQEYTRTYPANYHAAQLIEETEQALRHVLSPIPGMEESTTYGDDVYLSIDIDIQYLLDLAVQQVYEVQNPDYAVALVLDATTGDVLADTTYPFYNLNDRATISDFQKVNRALVSTIYSDDADAVGIRTNVLSKIVDHQTGQTITRTKLDAPFTIDLDEVKSLFDNPDGQTSIVAQIPAENPKYVVFIGSVNPRFYITSSVMNYVLSSIQNGLAAQRKL